MSKLTTRDELDYDHYKTKARNAWLRAKEGWLQWVEFVQPIRDRRLYQKGGYKTFEEFCEKEYGITRRNVDQLINSAFVVQGLPTNLRTDVLNEATARQLGKVESDNRVAVVEEAKRNGPVTAPAIKKAAVQIATKPPIPLDGTGFPIPKDCWPIWERSQEIQDVLTQLSRLKVLLEKKYEEKDPLFLPVPNYTAQQLEQIHFLVSHAKPYAVCTTCNGNRKVPCAFCRGTGLISKHNWDVKAPVEAKQARQCA